MAIYTYSSEMSRATMSVIQNAITVQKGNQSNTQETKARSGGISLSDYAALAGREPATDAD